MRSSVPLTVTGLIALVKASWFAGDGVTAVEKEEDTAFPIPERGILCIDTGCGKGGRLTAMTAEDGSFFLTSVPEQ